MHQIDKPVAIAYLKIKVQPNASKDEIVGMLGETLKVRVKAAPEGGKANASIESLLSTALGIHKTKLHIKTGLSQSHKLVEIQGMSSQEIKQKLKL